jgi:hypothetical protein
MLIKRQPSKLCVFCRGRGGGGICGTYNLKKVQRSVAGQLEVELLHDDQLHPLNVSLGELTTIAFHEDRQQRLHNLGVEKGG